MSEVATPENLSADQSQMVRDLYEAFNEFKENNVIGVPFDQKLHWNVVTKFVTLSMEFPHAAAISYEHFQNPEAAEAAEDEDFFATDVEANIYWLFLALRDFAEMTDTARLDDLSVFVEEHLMEVSKCCENYDALTGNWK